mmetsp:Transcript_29208/g.73302  ORF Transcript_29208/g.73302 Transcript_29208/m.73302 type:complete len:219 (-) Transcript_29208:52-708(-)
MRAPCKVAFTFFRRSSVDGPTRERPLSMALTAACTDFSITDHRTLVSASMSIAFVLYFSAVGTPSMVTLRSLAKIAATPFLISSAELFTSLENDSTLSFVSSKRSFSVSAKVVSASTPMSPTVSVSLPTPSLIVSLSPPRSGNLWPSSSFVFCWCSCTLRWSKAASSEPLSKHRPPAQSDATSAPRATLLCGEVRSTATKTKIAVERGMAAAAGQSRG